MLVERARTGDRRSLARLVSRVEDDTSEGRHALAVVYPAGGSAWVTGVTGAPGAGKSTLVDGLVAQTVDHGSVAVIAVDPSSPFTGGAVLGDRIRMQRHTDDPRVYIRSMANRGHLGGLADSTPRVVALLDGIGFDDVIVETVGVGQAEVDVAASADTVVVVVSPGWGDSVQAAVSPMINTSASTEAALMMSDFRASTEGPIPMISSIVWEPSRFLRASTSSSSRAFSL